MALIAIHLYFSLFRVSYQYSFVFIYVLVASILNSICSPSVSPSTERGRDVGSIQKVGGWRKRILCRLKRGNLYTDARKSGGGGASLCTLLALTSLERGAFVRSFLRTKTSFVLYCCYRIVFYTCYCIIF